MLLIDVNILVLSSREDVAGAAGMREWLAQLGGAGEPFCIPDFSWAGFVRVVTNRRIFAEATPISEALDFVEFVRGWPNHVPLSPGSAHWRLFRALCRDAGVRGDLVPDAYLAALAIETGSELITADRGFARYPGLRWRHPLSAGG